MSREEGVLRPPSERRSLLLRVVRNCPWNKCVFCPAYKEAKFSIRRVDDVIADLDEISALVEGGVDLPPQVDLWVRAGKRTVFLQDADALIAPYEDLKRVILAVKERFDTVERITTYSRVNTICHRSVEELINLRKSGLSRVHIGIESSSDEVLAFVKKGTSREKQLEACRRVKEAGLDLCCYVMPGLGGSEHSRTHAIETGRFIAEVEPTHTRLRTCYVLEGTPLKSLHERGLYSLQDDSSVIREIRLFLEQFHDRRSNLISDHRINLLLDLNGELPKDSEKLFSIIDRFLNLDEEEKDLFIAGRRLGIVYVLDQLNNSSIRSKIRAALCGRTLNRVSTPDYLL